MTWVWKNCRDVDDSELLLLLAMADYAHDNGDGIFPSVPKLAYKIRRSDRQTQRLLHGLAERGIIKRTGQLPDKRYIYQIVMTNRGGDIAMSPVTPRRHHPGDTAMTPGGGDTAMTPKPSDVTIKQPSNPPKPPKGGVYAAEFETFWSRVLRKEPSKAQALKSWERAFARHKDLDPAAVIAGLERWLPVWRQVEDASKIPHMTTWLNQDRWTVEQPTMPGVVSPNGHAAAEEFVQSERFEAIRKRAKELSGQP
jgi:hypothetical protein